MAEKSPSSAKVFKNLCREFVEALDLQDKYEDRQQWLDLIEEIGVRASVALSCDDLKQEHHGF